LPSIKKQIVNEIKAHIQNNGGEYRDWHVGICSSICYQRLVEAKAKHLFIARQAYSLYVAAEVQDYFVNTLGTEGGIEADDSNTDIIYAYKKSADAIEQTFPANDTSSEIIK
jgi:hypothetical protein